MRKVDLITTPQAARLLGCSVRTIHRLIVSGNLTPIMRANDGPNGAYLFARGDVEQLAKAQEEAGSPAVRKPAS
jgi:excisionase family DNA binding protein